MKLNLIKNIWTIGLLGLHLGVQAQDTLLYSTEPQGEKDPNPSYNSVFGLSNKPVASGRHWFKFDISDVFPRFYTPVAELTFGLDLGYEYLLNKNWSINTQLGIFKERYILNDNTYGDYYPAKLFLAFEPRYYLNKNKPWKPEGPYVSLRAGADFRSRYWYINQILDNKHSLIGHAALLYGYQSPIPNGGFVDFSFGLQAFMGTKPALHTINEDGEFLSKSVNTKGLTGFYKIRLGFGFRAGPNPEEQSRKAINYYAEEKQLVKLNLVEAFKFTEQDLIYNRISTRLDVSYERKLALAWSVNANVIADFSFFGLIPSLPSNVAVMYKGYNSIYGNVSIGPRYYFNQRRRVLNGTGGNNLSGDYLSLVGGYRHQFVENPMIIDPTPVDVGYLTALYGVQRRVFKNGYFDYQFGLGYRLNNSSLERYFLVSDLKIGIAF